MNLKKFSTILHSQFNYHTLPVTPFNKRDNSTKRALCHVLITFFIRTFVKNLGPNYTYFVTFIFALFGCRFNYASVIFKNVILLYDFF